MTTTLQQMLAEPKALIDLARTGEEVVLTEGGKPVVKLTGVVAQKKKASPDSLKKWMDSAAAAAAAAATGKRGMSTEEIIDDLRSERC